MISGGDRTNAKSASERAHEARVDALLPLAAGDKIEQLLALLSDGVDHPELWERFEIVVAPDLDERLAERLAADPDEPTRLSLIVLRAMCGLVAGRASEMRDQLAPLAVEHGRSPLLQGALFHINRVLDPENPKYRLKGKICPSPFKQLDVLEEGAYLCCPSWLGTTVGDAASDTRDDVWNSDTAQAIRASVHDGSYRYCNKGVCPHIQKDRLVPMDELLDKWSPDWRPIALERMVILPDGPEVVNLAYDRTCNLSCPSCRTDSFAADKQMRTRFAAMQERTILPLLKSAKTVFVTGSGDPFASKNFRQLMRDLTPEAYPELRFQIMTNGMLFTPRQWAAFPTLHRRVSVLRISVDAATGPTHELLRRGARWPVMLENLRFAGDLVAAGEIAAFELVFTVQVDNYVEMGDAVDLAQAVGATTVSFARIINWGTFTPEEYRHRAVFLQAHERHDHFLEKMQDARLRQPHVWLGNLQEFVRAEFARSAPEGAQPALDSAVFEGLAR